MPKKKNQSKKQPKKASGANGRQAKAYQHPIPSRNAILEYLDDAGSPQKLEAVLAKFSLKGQRMRGLLVDRLDAMVRAGQIIQNRRNEYCLTQKLALITGRVSGHKDGFGFVITDDDSDDIYLSAREMRPLFDGDRVAVKIVGTDRRGKPEGDVVEILERGTREVAGKFIRERGIGVVIPDNPKNSHRILIGKGDSAGAKAGQIVVVEILDFPSKDSQATGRILKIIGAPDQSGIATEIALHSHAIPTEWPKAVLLQADNFGNAVPSAAKKGRMDLRSLDLVTIDGADARDFDDAVYCEPSGKGWRLLVAIADVAHYVEINTPLDKEAERRGTSVYFPDRVVPMLPEVLSNGLCSLNPKVDRLCMVCDMQIDASGNVVSSNFAEGVMRSKARLTYGEVNAFLLGDTKSIPEFLHTTIRHLHDLYQGFSKARRRRGAIELDLPQIKFELDEEGVIKNIHTAPRNDAHRLIEECMITANVAAAGFLRKHRIPGLYRVHAKPDPERFDELRLYLLTLGLKVPHSEHVQAKQFAKLLLDVKDRPDSSTISMQMLRSLKHAEYTPDNIGHFGLALEAYAHFTSPIRRYPDLLVHRAIGHIVRGGKAGKYNYDRQTMVRLGVITSAYERRAEEATRDVEAWLKCQYMQQRVGDVYSGVVTGVTNFGLFVQISELMIDGLVHVTNLPNDYYQYDRNKQQLVGERTGQRYRLGEEMEVLVQQVDMETRRIDFRLAQPPAPQGAK
ncbi:MAG TPA: ribonuclease R [Woeseiaceae bacterium]|nr:ribonuclease R [Woeseiaceae bacterium]